MAEIESALKKTGEMMDLLKQVDKQYKISEKRWIQYYKDLYNTSETGATLKLSKEFPVK